MTFLDKELDELLVLELAVPVRVDLSEHLLQLLGRQLHGALVGHDVRHLLHAQAPAVVSIEHLQQDWKSDRSAKLKSGSKIHESMNAGFKLNN